MKKIDEGFTNKITELENGWIDTPHGTFTPNEYQGLSAYEVYEQFVYNLENPKPVPPTLNEIVQEQEVKIQSLDIEVKEAKQENADLYFELMMGGII